MVEDVGLMTGVVGVMQLNVTLEAQLVLSAAPVACAVTVNTPPAYNVLLYDEFNPEIVQAVALETLVEPMPVPSRYNRTMPVNALGSVPVTEVALAVYDPVIVGHTVVAANAAAAVEAVLVAQVPFCCVAV